MNAFSWAITGYLALLLLAFAAYLMALHRVPSDERPLTRTYDRLGRVLGLAENPDYRENLVDEEVTIESPIERLAISEAPLPEDPRMDDQAQAQPPEPHE